MAKREVKKSYLTLVCEVVFLVSYRHAFLALKLRFKSVISLEVQEEMTIAPNDVI